MSEGLEGTNNAGCAGSESVFATTEECPKCKNHLRLAGNLERAAFRLTCPQCGYQSATLTQDQVSVLI